MAIPGQLNSMSKRTWIGGFRNLSKAVKSPVRLVCSFYVSQYREIRWTYVRGLCNMVGDNEHWIVTLRVSALFVLLNTVECT